MKTEQIYLLITILLVVLFTVALTSKITVKPYYAFNLFRQHAEYEGFHPLNYSNVDIVTNTNKTAVDTYDNYLINRPGLECKKVHGFDGLYCKPYIADNKIDIFNGATGGLDCTGSGLTNSKGSLCLDKTMTSMLQTRGGNAKGVDSQIGH
jgi:hypothetical protein